MKVIDCVYGLLLLNEKKENFKSDQKNDIESNELKIEKNEKQKSLDQLKIQKLINQNETVSSSDKIENNFNMMEPRYESFFNYSMNYYNINQHNYISKVYNPSFYPNFNYFNTNMINVQKIIHIPKPIRANSLNE